MKLAKKFEEASKNEKNFVPEQDSNPRPLYAIPRFHFSRLLQIFLLISSNSQNFSSHFNRFPKFSRPFFHFYQEIKFDLAKGPKYIGKF